MLTVTKFSFMYWVFFGILAISVFGILKAPELRSSKRGAALALGSLAVFLFCMWEIFHAI